MVEMMLICNQWGRGSTRRRGRRKYAGEALAERRRSGGALVTSVRVSAPL